MSKPKTTEWMPVFVVVPATRELSMSDTERVVHTAPKTVQSGQDHWQRVGTARRRSDGGFDLSLTAIPVNGRLVMRPPEANESFDPTMAIK